MRGRRKAWGEDVSAPRVAGRGSPPGEASGRTAHPAHPSRFALARRASRPRRSPFAGRSRYRDRSRWPVCARPERVSPLRTDLCFKRSQTEEGPRESPRTGTRGRASSARLLPGDPVDVDGPGIGRACGCVAQHEPYGLQPQEVDGSGDCEGDRRPGVGRGQR